MLGRVWAESPRVLPAGQLPQDRRLGPLADLDGYFRFTPPASREAWQQRATQLRRQVLVAAGLWPMPVKMPLHAVIHGRVDRDGYTVEKVFFESYPGFFVTGNLYRPKGKKGTQSNLPGRPFGCYAQIGPVPFFPRRPVAGHSLAARPLAGRTLQRHRGEGNPQADRRGGRAVRGGRALSAASPLRATGPDGLRRVSLRHGRLCR